MPDRIDRIQQMTTNLEYYLENIAREAKAQIDEDIEIGHELGINAEDGHKRFTALAAIDGSCTWMQDYIIGIRANVKTAKEIGKVLFKEIDDDNQEG